MSELGPELSSFDECESDLINALRNFDYERGSLYERMAKIAGLLTVGGYRDLTETEPSDRTTNEFVNDATDAFTSLVQQIRIGSDEPEAAKIDIAKLLRLDDNERVELFRELTENNEAFDLLDEETALDAIDSIYKKSENEVGFETNISGLYRGLLVDDIKIFANLLETRQAEMSVQQDPQALTLILTIENVREVMKYTGLALGASIGYLLLRRFRT